MLRRARGFFTCAGDLVREYSGWLRRSVDLQGDYARLRRRREPYRTLYLECLEGRALLDGLPLTFSPTPSDPSTYTWTANNPQLKNWLNSSNQPTAWVPGDIAVFNAATAALGVNVSGTVQTEGMTFQGNYATSIAPASGGGQISTYQSSNIVVTGSQTAGPAAAAVVSTPITNTSGAGFQKTGNGTVTLAAGVGSLAFNSLTVSAGTLSIASAATVSGGAAEVDGTLSLSASGSSLTVAQSTVLTGAGTIGLAAGTALTYQSTAATSEFDGLLTGAGSLTVNSGILTIGGPANDYSGGTTVSGGTLRLKKGPGARPATLGSGTLDLQPGAVFDLNGCPFILGSVIDSASGGDTITDSSESGGVTVLTTGSGAVSAAEAIVDAL